MPKKLIRLLMGITLLFGHCHEANAQKTDDHLYQATLAFLTPGIMKGAAWAMKQDPVTITSFPAKRSAGDAHEFFSEGDYWWPDKSDPDGPPIFNGMESLIPIIL